MSGCVSCQQCVHIFWAHEVFRCPPSKRPDGKERTMGIVYAVCELNPQQLLELEQLLSAQPHLVVEFNSHLRMFQGGAPTVALNQAQVEVLLSLLTSEPPLKDRVRQLLSSYEAAHVALLYQELEVQKHLATQAEKQLAVRDSELSDANMKLSRQQSVAYASKEVGETVRKQVESLTHGNWWRNFAIVLLVVLLLASAVFGAIAGTYTFDHMGGQSNQAPTSLVTQIVRSALSEDTQDKRVLDFEAGLTLVACAKAMSPVVTDSYMLNGSPTRGISGPVVLIEQGPATVERNFTSPAYSWLVSSTDVSTYVRACSQLMLQEVGIEPTIKYIQ